MANYLANSIVPTTLPLIAARFSVPLKSTKSKTTPSVKLRDKVSVKLSGRWKAGRVVDITHRGRVAHVELESDATHRTVYAGIDSLRPTKK